MENNGNELRLALMHLRRIWELAESARETGNPLDSVEISKLSTFAGLLVAEDILNRMGAK